MAEFLRFAALYDLIRVTATAGVLRISGRRTRRSYDLLGVIVAECRNGFVRQFRITLRALALDHTRTFTRRRRLGYDLGGLAALDIRRFIDVNSITPLTGTFIISIPCGGTCSGYCIPDAIVMTESVYGVHRACTANRTFLMLLTVLGARGIFF